jgi:hypothetical protein
VANGDIELVELVHRTPPLSGCAFFNPLASRRLSSQAGCHCSAGRRQGEDAGPVAIGPSCDIDAVSSWTTTCAIDLCPLPFPTFALFVCFLLIVVAKIFTVPLPFSTVPAFPSDGLQFAISHPIPRMSILVTSLRQPPVLPTVCPSPSASHDIGLDAGRRAVSRSAFCRTSLASCLARRRRRAGAV